MSTRPAPHDAGNRDLFPGVAMRMDGGPSDPEPSTRERSRAQRFVADAGEIAVSVVLVVAVLVVLPGVFIAVPMILAEWISMGWGALAAAMLGYLSTKLVRPNGAMVKGALAITLPFGLWVMAIMMAVVALVRWVA